MSRGVLGERGGPSGPKTERKRKEYNKEIWPLLSYAELFQGLAQEVKATSRAVEGMRGVGELLGLAEHVRQAAERRASDADAKL